MELGIKEGAKLISLARKSIEAGIQRHFDKELEEASQFHKKSGIFVSLYNGKNLRGCVGVVMPVMSLRKATVEAAQAAAFSDPRFYPITESELKHVRIEVSVLTEPEMIDKSGAKSADILKGIKVGRDGLLVKYSGFSGLLLPQVAVEQGWGAQKFMEQTCIKAGISSKDWKEKDCQIYKFQAQIFSEQEPMGKVVEKKL